MFKLYNFKIQVTTQNEYKYTNLRYLISYDVKLRYKENAG